MKPNRLEAFSDGVLAIIITIMVLEMKIPEGSHFEDLLPVVPVALSYLFSFIILGIYWNNHHHLMQATTKVKGKILWANLNLLFWLSLFPFTTAWMWENPFEKNPVALYGLILLLAAIAYKMLARYIAISEGKESVIGKAFSRDRKGNFSILAYSLAVLTSFYQPVVSILIYIAVAFLWLIPESRIEKNLKPTPENYDNKRVQQWWNNHSMETGNLYPLRDMRKNFTQSLQSAGEALAKDH